jgi:hypothetical protein
MCWGILMYFCVELQAQDAPDYVYKKRINWGIKTGVNTDIPIVSIHSEHENLRIETTNKVGFMVDGMMCINFNQFFLQPELGYNRTSEIFHIIEDDGSIVSNKATVQLNIKAVNCSALFGYYSVRENEYGLSVFSGCKLKNTYHIHTTCPGQEDTHTHDEVYNLYISSGVKVYISKLFFDFRYDVALLDKTIQTPQLLLDTYGDLGLIKRDNILSFSIGLMF